MPPALETSTPSPPNPPLEGEGLSVFILIFITGWTLVPALGY